MNNPLQSLRGGLVSAAIRTTLITLVAAAAGCAWPPGSAGQRLACEDARPRTVAFDTSTDRAVLVAHGSSRSMPRQPSGSGARYGDGSTELWIKGREAVLIEGRARLACRFED